MCITVVRKDGSDLISDQSSGTHENLLNSVGPDLSTSWLSIETEP